MAVDGAYFIFGLNLTNNKLFFLEVFINPVPFEFNQDRNKWSYKGAMKHLDYGKAWLKKEVEDKKILTGATSATDTIALVDLAVSKLVASTNKASSNLEWKLISWQQLRSLRFKYTLFKWWCYVSSKNHSGKF